MLCSQHSQEEGQLASEGSSLSWTRPLPVWQLHPIFRLLWHSTTCSFPTLQVSFLVCLFCFFHLFSSIFYFIFNWRKTALQYCVSFCHPSTWISHRLYICPLPRTSDPTVPLSGCHRTPGLNSLHHTANSHWLAILNMVIYMFQHHSFNSSHPLLSTLGPQVCSLCLHLHCCPANRFISTIFLGSICVC